VIKRCRELGFGKVRVALLAMLIWRQIGQRWHSVWEERKGEERSMNEACNVKLKWQSRGREVTSAALESFWRSTFCLFRTARQAEEEAGDEKKKNLTRLIIAPRRLFDFLTPRPHLSCDNALMQRC
jgi:hypothetical protein